jgi:hypothetical protein
MSCNPTCDGDVSRVGQMYNRDRTPCSGLLPVSLVVLQVSHACCVGALHQLTYYQQQPLTPLANLLNVSTHVDRPCNVACTTCHMSAQLRTSQKSGRRLDCCAVVNFMHHTVE